MAETVYPASHGSGNEISRCECQAIRALDRDKGYTRSELAFLFECKVGTIQRHADGECNHQIERSIGPGDTFDETQLLTAYRVVYDKQPYDKMSGPTYEQHRPDEFPSAATISRRFGSWTEARRRARGVEE